MDTSIKNRIKNQIFKFEYKVNSDQDIDSVFTLDYESGRYRQNELVSLIRDVVPYFALTESELKSIDLSEVYRTGFTRISDARSNAKGDYGELLLYIVLSIFYDAPKFVTKARLRSITREQIKGFDCAHFSLDKNGAVTLWLGEAKFYKDINSAITSSLHSLSEHLTDSEKIKSELKLLGGNIEINKDLDREIYYRLKSYVDGGMSLDKVNIKVPVLLTYDSACISEFCGQQLNIDSEDFKTKMKTEVEKQFQSIRSKTWPASDGISIVFFLIPLENVEDIKQEIQKVEDALKI